MVKIPSPPVTYSGGCQCGALRYRFQGPMGKAVICHCRMCQKAFGSFGATLVSLEARRLTWTRGTPGIFRSSSIVSRGFCSRCGTPMFMREDGDKHYEMAIGTLDDPAAIPALTEQVGVESRLPWFETISALPERRTAEDRSPQDLEKLKSLQHPDHDTETWP